MDQHPPGHEAARLLTRLGDALARADVDAAAALFAEDCYWRDLAAFSWNLTTAEGKPAIADMVRHTLPAAAPTGFAPADWPGDARADAGPDALWFTFETATGRGIGQIRLQGGRCRTLFTALRELKGFEEREGATRERGVRHGAFPDRITWADARAAEQAAVAADPYVLVVGGGQGGLGLAARLKRIGVPALVIDRRPRPGDAWRARYKSLCLHDPVWYDHMPCLPFPAHWPIYTPKDKLGDWLEAYAHVMELDFWGDTACEHARFDAGASRWTVTATRAGQKVTLRPTHLVLATGMSGVPAEPRLPGRELFRGTQYHSSHHPGGAGWRGKRCAIVGANNSAHDICHDLWEHGADVTMIQRSPTTVVRAETLLRLGAEGVYSEQAVACGIDVDRADLITASQPYALTPALHRAASARIQAEDADFYARLAASGFLLDFGADGSGLSSKYLRRGSGYYIDVGASQLVIDGRIKLRSGVEPVRITEGGLVLSDGSELAADLIVYATGFGSMNGWAEQLISPEVADLVGPCWGLGSATEKDPGPWQGELRNMWKPTRQPNLWFHGGNLAQSRHYSRYLALQLKARLEGIPTPLYPPA